MCVKLILRAFSAASTIFFLSVFLQEFLVILRVFFFLIYVKNIGSEFLLLYNLIDSGLDLLSTDIC